MSARQEVLNRIRTALGPNRPSADVPAPAYRRGGAHPPGAAALIDLLAERLEDYKATVVRTSADNLASTLARVIEQEISPAGRLVLPAGAPADWRTAAALVDDGTASAAQLDASGGVLTACRAACAETGTIVLDAAPDQGRRILSLVPDRHLCVVRAEQVVQTIPELLERLDPRRPLTFISGPSATSDIELQRVEGVHGPRTLIVVLVG